MTAEKIIPAWRSMLYVPVTNERFVAKAAARGADAIKLDLEDSIPAQEKARARGLVKEAVALVSGGGVDVLVRVNRPLRLAVPDIEASVWPGLAGLVLPKVESADQVMLLAELVDELEVERGLTPGSVGFMVLIETAKGYAEARAIAHAPRVVAIALGQEDFAAAMGMAEPDADALIPPMQHVQVAAREAGVLPVGYPGSIAVVDDLDSFRAGAVRGRALGFDGGACIHPAQVPILNEAFSPTSDEIAYARRVIAAYDEATAAGTGAISLDGKMIDVPIVDRAARIVAKAERFGLS